MKAVFLICVLQGCFGYVIDRSKCPEVCSYVYDPVCGTDGKTYSNRCYLLISTCHNPMVGLKRSGECPKPCPEKCFGYDPVCGTDGRTYGSLCQLENVNCNGYLDITVAKKGWC